MVQIVKERNVKLLFGKYELKNLTFSKYEQKQLDDVISILVFDNEKLEIKKIAEYLSFV